MPIEFPKEHGVYVFDRGSRSWRKVVADGPWVPGEDGVYVVYFRNEVCPGCKAFDRVWVTMLTEYLDKVNATPALAYCKNFFFECNDATASDTFLLFLVNATPQVIVLIVENGELRYVERNYGFIPLEELLDFVNNARERMEQMLKSQGVEEGEEGEALWIEGENWKEIVERLRKMIFEGRNIKEVCDEKGCRYVIE